MTKIWITRYLFTKGLYSVDAEIAEGTAFVPIPNTNREIFLYGKEWHRTYEDAKQHAEQLKQKKIKELREAIARVEALTF